MKDIAFDIGNLVKSEQLYQKFEELLHNEATVKEKVWENAKRMKFLARGMFNYLEEF